MDRGQQLSGEPCLMPKSDVDPSLFSPTGSMRSVTREQVDATASALHAGASTLARDLVSGETQLQNQISNHYLSGLKYGMVGSDGSIGSNYIRYMANNHDISSL